MAVERHHGVCSVTEYDCTILVMIWLRLRAVLKSKTLGKTGNLYLQGYQWASRVVRELLEEHVFPNQLHNVREVFLEPFNGNFRRAEEFKFGVRCYQCTCESLVLE